MRFALTEDQSLIQRTARDALARACTPAHVRAAWASPRGRVAGLWPVLAELGLPGLLVPEALGGAALGMLELAVVAEELGWSAAPEPLVEVAVGAALLAEVDPARAAEWLPRVAAGEALVMPVDVSAGPALVPFPDEAALWLLWDGARLHATEALEGVPAGESVDGARRLWRVSGPGVGAAPLAGEAPAAAVTRARTRLVIAAAAQLVGLGRRALDLGVEHARTRQQFGRPIGSFQAVKHHLANALMAVEFARPLVWRAAAALEGGSPRAAVHASMAKAAASEAAEQVGRASLQVHGAMGYSYEYDLHLFLKRAWWLARAHGDARTHRALVLGHALAHPEEGWDTLD